MTYPLLAEPAEQQNFILQNADYHQYEQLRHSMDERGQRAFLTFDGHRIEIMSPSLQHDRSGELLGLLVRCLASAANIKYRSGGSTTFKKRELKRGLEPDKCFWIQSQEQMRGVNDVDLNIHPPPDLVIEVEISRRLLDRKGIYGRMGVPEIWLYDGQSFRILILDRKGNYQPRSSSLAFADVRIEGVVELIERAGTLDELAWERAARRWAKQHLKRK